MYNTKIKERYIKFRNANVILSDNYSARMFAKTYPFEANENKDVCNFSAKEIENMYKTWNLSSIESLLVYNSNLSLYTQWCQEEGLVVDGMNHYTEFDKASLGGMINKALFNMRIVSREDVLNWCRQLENPVDAFVILGMFEGIYGVKYSDFFDLYLDDIKGNTLTIRNPDNKKSPIRKIEVSDELINYAHLAASIDKYGWTSGANVRTAELEGNYQKIVKKSVRKNSTDNMHKTIYGRLKKCFDFLDVAHMRPAQINESGMIYFINRKANELNISTNQYIRENKDAILNQFDFSIDSTKQFCEKYANFLK